MYVCMRVYTTRLTEQYGCSAEVVRILASTRVAMSSNSVCLQCRSGVSWTARTLGFKGPPYRPVQSSVRPRRLSGPPGRPSAMSGFGDGDGVAAGC